MKLRPRSLERYEGIVRRQIIPTLGSLHLQVLTAQHIARAYGELARPRPVTIRTPARRGPRTAP